MFIEEKIYGSDFSILTSRASERERKRVRFWHRMVHYEVGGLHDIFLFIVNSFDSEFDLFVAC